ncbi:MAG: S9 family peptidase [Chromatiales bacterium]|nr:MAG: S9 family peptidase [Chromatiales bacterium]
MRMHTVIAIIFFALSTLAQAAPDSKSFGALPDIYDAAISPDASQIAMVMNVDGVLAIRVLRIDNLNEPIRAVGLDDGVKPGWIRWANNDRVLVKLSKYETIYGGAGWASFIYTLDANTMQGKILVEPKDILRQDNAYVIDFLEDDPDHILMAFSDRTQMRDDIQRVNVETGKYARLKRGLEGVQYWHTDQRGEPRIGQGRIDKVGDDFEWRLLIRDVNADKWRPSKEFPGLDPDTLIIGFNENPNELLIGYRGEKDTLGIYVYDLDNKQIGEQLFHHDEYDVSGVVRNVDGEMIGVRYVADIRETVLFKDHDSHLGQIRMAFGDYDVSFVDQSSDESRLIFRISSASDPGSLLLSDRRNNKIMRISQNRSRLAAGDMGSVVATRYEARDGTEIPIYITLPPTIRSLAAAKGVPTIVLPHGGPYSRSYRRFDYFSQFFATRGYVVVQMNFRGSAGYGEEYEEAGRSDWVLMQEDVEDATRWVLQNGIADPDRTCIAGWSYGGYAALMGSIKNPELYSCAISIAGVTDVQRLASAQRDFRFGRTAARKFILSGFEDKQAMRDNSPARRADELTVPLFLAHATEDLSVPFNHFRWMQKALGKNDTKVEYLEVKRDDHYFSEQKNREALFMGLHEFLESTNGPSEFAN